MRQVLGALVAVLLVGGTLAGCVLVQAHWQVRSIDPVIPPAAQVLSLQSPATGPVALRYVNTASQGISHPAYLLEWPDGRVLMLDAGMSREAAEDFGRPMELLLGAAPIVTHGSVPEQIGDDIERVYAVAFTHLHTDHTNGLIPVCDAIGHDIELFQTSIQVEEVNYTTRPGAAQLEDAACAKPRVLAGPGPHDVPGFPGLVAVAAGGHTPGSTVFIASLPHHTWVFAGDIQNSKADLLANRPKAWLYSTLLIPEASERLERLRLWLSEIERDPKTTVVVAHDLTAAIADGLRPWRP